MDKFIGFDSGEFRELTGEIEQAFCNVQDVWINTDRLWQINVI